MTSENALSTKFRGAACEEGPRLTLDRRLPRTLSVRFSPSVLRNAVSDVRANVNLWPAMIKAER